MIPILRKRHQQVWFLLAFILPIFFIIAHLAIPQLNNPKNESKILGSIHLEKKILSNTKSTFQYTILSSSDDSIKQLVLKSNQSLASPTLGVYFISAYALEPENISKKDIEQSVFLGYVSNKEETIFSLTSADISLPSTIIIYDNIRNKTIEILNVKL